MSALIALLKPRVMFLVVFTGIAGLLVAPGTLHPVLAAHDPAAVEPIPPGR